MAGTLRVRVDCRVEGPLADGAAARASEEWSTATSQALGEQAVQMLGAVPMNKSGRSTGVFRASLKVDRVSATTVRVPGVQQRGVTWASWLEGTSQRNQGSKFKGYRLFRKARLALDKMAPQVAQAVLDGLKSEIGGA